MPTDKCNSTTIKAIGLILSLLGGTSAQQVPFGIPLLMSGVNGAYSFPQFLKFITKLTAFSVATGMIKKVFLVSIIYTVQQVENG